MKSFNLMIRPCPPGHTLSVTDTKDEYQCQCNDNDNNIIDCIPNERKVILEVSNNVCCLPHILLCDLQYSKVYGHTS